MLQITMSTPGCPCRRSGSRKVVGCLGSSSHSPPCPGCRFRWSGLYETLQIGNPSAQEVLRTEHVLLTQKGCLRGKARSPKQGMNFERQRLTTPTLAAHDRSNRRQDARNQALVGRHILGPARAGRRPARLLAPLCAVELSSDAGTFTRISVLGFMKKIIFCSNTQPRRRNPAVRPPLGPLCPHLLSPRQQQSQPAHELCGRGRAVSRHRRGQSRAGGQRGRRRRRH